MINNDESLTQQIKQQLDAQVVDADTRLALQQVRVKALSTATHRGWRMPWLEFAVTASLLTVLAVTIPAYKPAKSPERKSPSAAQVAETRGIRPPATASTPSNNISAKPMVEEPANQIAADAELLENLDLYEDAEFFQWLSEQPQQGAHDA